MPIYKNIKKIALIKNIQQKEIAEAFGVTENTMTNYLTGRTKINADQLPLFAKTLRVSIEDLFNDTYSATSNSIHPQKPEVKYFACEDCIEKQIKLDKACELLKQKDNELIEFQRKYINLLEEINNIKGNRNCG